MGVVGAYGKMPGLGDFFRINVRAGFVGPWDLWLQSGLQAVRVSLGARWQECYMSAPLWRFTLNPAVAGRMAAQGVMMPSVDRVGRTFPLTLVWPGPVGGLTAHIAATPVFEVLEEIALTALEDCSKAALAAAIDDVLPQADNDVSLPDQVQSIGVDANRARTIWSTVLQDETYLMGCNGLPDIREMPALFDLASPIWSQARKVAQ